MPRRVVVRLIPAAPPARWYPRAVGAARPGGSSTWPPREPRRGCVSARPRPGVPTTRLLKTPVAHEPDPPCALLRCPHTSGATVRPSSRRCQPPLGYTSCRSRGAPFAPDFCEVSMRGDDARGWMQGRGFGTCCGERSRGERQGVADASLCRGWTHRPAGRRRTGVRASGDGNLTAGARVTHPSPLHRCRRGVPQPGRPVGGE